VFNVALWDGPNREDTIYRSKAVGEPPFMLGISALMALSDAVAACGDGSVYPALDAPATAERVLMAVRAGAAHELRSRSPRRGHCRARAGRPGRGGGGRRLAPREAGAAMLVWAAGQSGTIGGGALEFEAAARAMRGARHGARPARPGRRWDPALGQCCGGAVTLLTEVGCRGAARPRWRGGRAARAGRAGVHAAWR
jgi:hypothetical protein